MNKRRRYDFKNKRSLIIILIVSIVIIGVFSLFIYRYSKASKVLYKIDSGSFIQDINNNYLAIDDDMELKIRWNGNYYVSYEDKNVNLGKRVITYNTITGGMKLYGEFYEIKKDGKIVEYRNETDLPNTTIPKFYKIDDRKYLVVDSKIVSEDYSIEANNYLLVELDKMGNAKLSNNKLNLKTITPTKLVTADYVFDIANEILKFGDYSIDLKKIIGSTNQYVPETEVPTTKPNNSQSGGSGSGNGTGTGGGGGSSSSGNSNNKGDILPTEEIFNKVKMTSVVRIIEGITQIDVDYVIYDPFNEYTSVYVEVISESAMDRIDLLKTQTHLLLNNLEANTDYKLNFIYTTEYVDPDTGTTESMRYTFDSFELKTKMPEYAISVYRLSRFNNTLSYKVDLQSGYEISKVNVHMEFEYEEKNEETGETIPKVAVFDDIQNAPPKDVKYVIGEFKVKDYVIDSNTVIKLTVKSVIVDVKDKNTGEVIGEKEIPINSSYTFRFGGSNEKVS